MLWNNPCSLLVIIPWNSVVNLDDLCKCLSQILMVASHHSQWLDTVLGQLVDWKPLLPSKPSLLAGYIQPLTKLYSFFTSISPMYTCIFLISTDGSDTIFSSVWFYLQNMEPEVTIDTVPNVKKKHQVHVGMCKVVYIDRISILCKAFALLYFWTKISIHNSFKWLKNGNHLHPRILKVSACSNQCAYEVLPAISYPPSSCFHYLLTYYLLFTAAISNSFGFGGHNSVVVFAPFMPWTKPKQFV